MEQSKGLAHDFFLDPDVMKTHDFHEFEKLAWDLINTRNHTPRPLEKHRSFASEAREVKFTLVVSTFCNRAPHDFKN